MEWSTILLALIIAAVVLSGVFSRLLPGRFLGRGCMGREWRRRFPNAGKQSIRRFLGVFTDAFGLPVRHRLGFSPHDKVLDIYRDMYPHRGVPDELELETFVLEVRENFGIDLSQGDNKDITLGDIYSRISQPT